MVERLKEAIEKAREARRSGQAARPALPPTADWSRLASFDPAPAALDRARIVAARRTDVAHLAFDVLRTRVMKICRDNGWRRLAVTSPTKGCGKSMVTINLGYSLARKPDTRALIVELDLRAPSIKGVLGLPRAVSGLRAILGGEAAPEDGCVRIAPGLALCVAESAIPDSAELLQSARMKSVLARLDEALSPDAILFDLPPMLGGDDVLALLPEVDAVLLVVAAGRTTPAEIEECERLLGDSVPFLGVVLNKVERADAEPYDEGYAAPIVT